MKYLFILLFLFNTAFSSSQESEIENNQLKYWNYRERLTNNFVAVGSDAGQSLPFATRNRKNHPKLAQGEGGIVLGSYIGVLATEYKLLKQNKEDTTQTLKELYYALYAFNRLDLFAETVNSYNKPAKLDGFFVRDDYPDNFVKNNPSLNKNTLKTNSFNEGTGKTFTVKCTNHKGKKLCGKSISKDCVVKENPKGYSSKYEHSPMSWDQMLGILIGVALVEKLIDEDVNYQNKIFQDNETSLKKEAQNIAKRIIKYTKKYNWSPKEPDGDYIGDCNFRGKSKPNYFKNNATIYYFPRLVSNIGKQIYGEKESYFYFLDPFGGLGSLGFDFYQRRMYIEMMTLSNKDNNPFVSTANKVKRISEKHNWEPYYYTMGRVLHDWEKDENVDNQTLSMLNSAPFDGPYFHGVTEFGKGGWATENRFSASLGEQYHGNRFPEETGNYSGLDFMLLHNMYLLTQDNTSFSYEKIQKIEKTNYKVNSSKINTKKCVKAKMQSCKERKKYYKFLKGLCKGSESKCKKQTEEMFIRKFGVGIDGVNTACKKSIFKTTCTL